MLKSCVKSNNFKTFPLKTPLKANIMNQVTSTHVHPIVHAFRVLINKLRQNPEVYPIRYYKKGRNFRRAKADLYK